MKNFLEELHSKFFSSNKASEEKSLGKRPPQIRVAKKVYREQALKKSALMLGNTFLALLIIYLCFASTIIRVIPATNEVGLIVVKNATFPGGIAPINAQMVVNVKTVQETDFFSRLKQAFLPSGDVALVEVLAGPTGRVTWAASGLVTIDGNPISVSLPVAPSNEFLNDEYLVKCLKGSCKEGAGFIISAKNIYGEPLNKIKGVK